MRSLTVKNRIGFDKSNPIHNSTDTIKKEGKDVIVPRFERTFNIPTSLPEMVESLSGEQNIDKFLEIICEDYSLIAVRAELARLDPKSTTMEAAVDILSKVSENFTLASILADTERVSQVKVKAGKVDAIAELAAKGLSAEEFQSEVAKVLASLR